MPQPARVIQTRYDGCYFRSRTEARWAVFFKTLGFPYEYEKEGYDLPAGRYLPDFWLPQQRCWFEVKGEPPTTDEIHKASWLNMLTEAPVIIGVGSPRFQSEQLFHIPIIMTPYEAHRGSGDLGPRFWFAPDDHDHRLIVLASRVMEDILWWGHPSFSDRRLADAYEAARSARFGR